MKILIIKTSSMGDIIHTLPAITDASKKIPGITFDWLVEENFTEIPKWHKNVNRVIPIALRRWRKDLLSSYKNHEIKNFLQQLQAEKYDCIIDAQGLLKSALITLFARGNNKKAKCGLGFTSAREPLASFCYQQRFTIKKNQHAIMRLRELFAKVLKYPVPLDFPDYGINIRAAMTDKTKPYLVFVPFASRSYKLWSEQKWSELILKAEKNNYFVKIPWGNEVEKQAAERIVYYAKNNALVLPKMSLTELAEEFVNSSGIIAVDTGLAHLAAALNVPTVALYGKTKSNLIGIFGKKQKHIENFQDIEADDVWHEFIELIL